MAEVGNDPIIPEETPEQIEARTHRYAEVSKELQCEYEEYSEDWYRTMYPKFPDYFYQIFAKFSKDQRKSILGNK